MYEYFDIHLNSCIAYFVYTFYIWKTFPFSSSRLLLCYSTHVVLAWRLWRVIYGFQKHVYDLDNQNNGNIKLLWLGPHWGLAWREMSNYLIILMVYRIGQATFSGPKAIGHKRFAFGDLRRCYVIFFLHELTAHWYAFHKVLLCLKRDVLIPKTHY